MAKSVKQPRKRRTRVYVIKTADLDNSLLTGVYDILSRKNPLFKFVIDDKTENRRAETESYLDLCKRYRNDNNILGSDFILLFSDNIIEASLLSDSDDTGNIVVSAAGWDNNTLLPSLLYLAFTELVVFNFPKDFEEIGFVSYYGNLKSDLRLNKISLESAMQYCVNLSEEELFELWRGAEDAKKINRRRKDNGNEEREKLDNYIRKVSKVFSDMIKDKNVEDKSKPNYEIIILDNKKIQIVFFDKEIKKYHLNLYPKDTAFYVYFLIWQSHNYCDIDNLNDNDKKAFMTIYNFLKRGEEINLNSVKSEFSNFYDTKHSINNTIKTTLEYRFSSDFLIKQELKGTHKYGVPGVSKNRIFLEVQDLLEAVSKTNLLHINNRINKKNEMK